MTEGVMQGDDRTPSGRRATGQGMTGPGRTIPRLTFAEQIVLWSARRLAVAGQGAAATESDAWACQQAVRTRVATELGVALRATGVPDAGREAAVALERTLDIFGRAGVRGLRLNRMCCRFVSNDERLFLSLLAACQAGDCAHTSALLSWFLPPAAMRIAATEAAAFAAAMHGAGFLLPQRLRLPASAGFPCAGPADTAAPPTLH